ncbi:MAG: hypothetical protein KatS3mg077_3197 [Candidatus Binatia bacterium]|nr:MAG: hypothetical protein KatS3mg077_3197 [Candidatus Binatia bacterium]
MARVRSNVRLEFLACGFALLCMAPSRQFPGVRRFVAVTPRAGEADPARLAVVATDQTSDGRRIALRAVVRNDGDEPVAGIRLVLRLLASAAPDARELDRFYKFLEVRLPPGGTEIVRWDVYTVYAGQTGASGFVLEAYAARKGDTSFPPPAGWKDM